MAPSTYSLPINNKTYSIDYYLLGYDAIICCPDVQGRRVRYIRQLYP
jgi:hypothetical protein